MAERQAKRVEWLSMHTAFEKVSLFSVFHNLLVKMVLQYSASCLQQVLEVRKTLRSES
jgi:hypothetical protein